MNSRQQCFGFPTHSGTAFLKDNQTFLGNNTFRGTSTFNKQCVISTSDNPQLKILNPLDSRGFTFYYDGASHGLTIAQSGSAGGSVAFSGLGISMTTITSTGSNGDNFLLLSQAGVAGQLTIGNLLPSGASGICQRIGLSGNGNTVLSASAHYGALTLGSNPCTEAGSGTHPVLANLIVRPLTVTNGAGATTNTASIYIEGAQSAGITPTGEDYAIWSDSGINRFDGVMEFGVTVSSAASLTLDSTANVWVFSGSSGTTWTLPAVSGKTGWRYMIKNRGSAAITLNSNAGGNDIYNTVAGSSLTINAGEAYTLVNDGTYFLIGF